MFFPFSDGLFAVNRTGLDYTVFIMYPHFCFACIFRRPVPRLKCEVERRACALTFEGVFPYAGEGRLKGIRFRREGGLG